MGMQMPPIIRASPPSHPLPPAWMHLPAAGGCMPERLLQPSSPCAGGGSPIATPSHPQNTNSAFLEYLVGSPSSNISTAWAWGKDRIWSP